MRAFFAILAVAATASEAQNFFYNTPLVGSPLVHHASPLATPFTYIKPSFELKKDSDKEITLKKIAEEKKVVPSVYYNTISTPFTGYNGLYNNLYANTMYTANPVMRIAKREAEAEPQFLQYSSPIMHHNLYNHHAATPISYSVPTMHNIYNAMYKPAQMYYQPLAMPVEYKKVDQYMKVEKEMIPEMKEYKMEMMADKKMFDMKKVMDNAREKINTPEYAGKGMYVAENEGAVHIAKREAEGQFLSYNALPYTYNTMPYNYNNLAYNNLYANTYSTAGFPYASTLRYNTPYQYVY